MCSISSELVVKSEPQIVTSFHQKDASKRKTHLIVIDISPDDKCLGFEIVNIKSKVSKDESHELTNDYIIDKIVHDSPAYKANLKKDDRIIEINKHNVFKLDLSEVQFLIKESKRAYKNQIEILIDRLVDEEICLSNSSSFADVRNFTVSLKNQLNKDSKNSKPIIYDPDHKFWKVLRLGFYGLVLGVLIILVAFILVVIVMHPKCEKLPESVWWKHATVYRIKLDKVCKNKPNGQCFNELKETVDYFSQLNANALLLSNILDASVNFNANYGTVEDFKSFINYTHSQNIEVFMDFIPNYMTNESKLFQLALENPKYRNYFIWTNEPNNWVDFDGNSAWTKFNDTYFLHQFGKNKFDLNYRNQDVYNNLMEALTYWCDLGVDGINLLGAGYLFKDIYLRNEANPRSSTHEYTKHQRENIYLIADIKNKIYPNILMLDAEDIANENESEIKNYYGNDQISGFDLIPREAFKINEDLITENIEAQLKHLQHNNKIPSWTLNPSSLKKLNNEKLTSSLYALLFLLPGSVLIDFDDDFYEYLIAPNQNTRHTLKSSLNHTMNQHSAYELEQLILQFSKQRSKSKSILLGRTKFHHFNNSIGLSRAIAVEKNYLIFFNTNSFQEIDIEFNSKEFKLANVAAKVEYTNGKLENTITFDEFKIPISKTNLCPYCSVIISWPFQRVDVKEIFDKSYSAEM